MIEPNSNERIASSRIVRSSLHYINLQFGGQRGNIAAGLIKAADQDGAKLEAGSLTICKPAHTARDRGRGVADRSRSLRQFTDHRF
jgi:hypothetical protein